ncbi:MAG TPA: carboxy terminal-processing peptidase, partial [Gillisia sp.]|nr:carboxy terminal-processing peptidase [Gillisia sp.]
ENPLAWDQIKPAKYKVWDGYIDYDEVIKKSKQRMEANAQLSLIDENARWVKEQRDEEIYPLQYEAYHQQRTTSQEEAKKFNAISKYTSNLSYTSLPYELELTEKDSTLKEKRVRWHKNLTSDVYIEEAINVLDDININNIKKGKLADIRK